MTSPVTVLAALLLSMPLLARPADAGRSLDVVDRTSSDAAGRTYADVSGRTSTDVAGGGFGAIAPDSLSIEDCVERARRLAPEVQAALLDLEEARYDSAATVRGRRPSVAFLGHLLVAPQGFYDPAITNLGEYGLKLGVTWPITGPGAARRARALAASDVRARALERDRLSLEAGRRAAELATGLLRLGEEERIQSEALGWLQDLSSLLTSEVRAGSAGPSDSVRVILERDEVAAGLDQIRVEAAADRRELLQITGLPGPAPPIRALAPEQAPAAPDSLRLLERAGFLPEVQASRNEQERASLETAEARARKAWKIEAEADAGLAGTNLTAAVPPEIKEADPNASLGDRLRRDLGASLTLDAQRPLYDPTYAPSVAAREAAARAAVLRTTAQENLQGRLAIDLLERWEAAWRRLEAAQRSAARAQENLTRLKSLYAAGSTSLLDLLDGRRVLDDARQRLAEARAEARLVRAEAEIRP